MTEDRTYDVVVLGAGAVGENVADRASRTGLSVALVEDGLVGGECSYYACMPSKALLRPGAVLAEARQTPGAGAVGAVDPAATLAARDAIVHGWDDSSQVSWVEGAGLALLRGRGRVVGPRVVEVVDDAGATTVRARHAVVVATGSEPVIPDVPGLRDADPWTSRDATALTQVPADVAIVGGGVVACEMATALADLGAAVTVIARGWLLSAMEPFAGEAVAASLAAMGVDVRLEASLASVERAGAGVRLTLGDGQSVHAERVLVATGRRPRTAGLGVESLGLAPGAPLSVDDTGLVADVDGGWLYAVGDVTGRTATTHQGKYDARATGDAIAYRFGSGAAGEGPGDTAADGAAADGAAADGAAADGAAADGAEAVDGSGDWSRFRATADHAAVPQVVFTRPEVATVGLTEAAARDAGIDVRTVTVPFTSVAGAAFTQGDPGTAHLVVDAARRVVVGATFVGPEVAELLHAATVAIVGEVPLDRLWHAVPAYPTRSEIWLRLLEAYGL